MSDPNVLSQENVQSAMQQLQRTLPLLERSLPINVQGFSPYLKDWLLPTIQNLHTVVNYALAVASGAESTAMMSMDLAQRGSMARGVELLSSQVGMLMNHVREAKLAEDDPVAVLCFGMRSVLEEFFGVSLVDDDDDDDDEGLDAGEAVAPAEGAAAAPASDAVLETVAPPSV